MFDRIQVSLFALALAAGAAPAAWAQPNALNGANGATAAITATSTLPSDKWIPARHSLDITLSRTPAAGEGRIAVMVGTTDISDLVEITGSTVRYTSRLPLPAGESQVAAYVVTPANEWQEIARFPVRILTPRGYEQAQARPSVDLGWKGQLVERHSPDTNAPTRPGRYNDFTLAAGFDGRQVRNGVTWSNTAAVLGSSFAQEALRFSEQGEEAPSIDLSSYLVKVERGRLNASLGHGLFNGGKHLITNFASRGASVVAPLGTRGTFSLAALNGTNIVGWNNPLGVTRDDHRLVTGTLALELLPRAGGLRAETTFLSGSMLPFTGFNQGAITDAQESRGVAVRVVGADATQRFSIDGGLTRSRFVNPIDPLLSQGTTLVPVRDESRNARYVDASVAVIKDQAIGKTARASLTLFARHEQVDPLFKSIAATLVQPDLKQNQLEAQVVLGQVTLQVVHARLEDNLENIESALKTLTRRNTVNATLPLGSFARPELAGRFPRVVYMYDRLHQFGDHLPVNSDFAASHVPDQQNSNQTLAVEWSLSKWRAAYRFGKSFQDNRQVGRVTADLGNLTHLVALAVTPAPELNLAIETSIESADNLELVQTDRTKRFAATGEWRVTPAIALQSMLSSIWMGDLADTRTGRTTQFDAQASWQVRLAKKDRQKPSARVFVKFSRLTGSTENLPLGLALALREGWSMTSGLTLSLF
jgi:hypothetical protein